MTRAHLNNCVIMFRSGLHITSSSTTINGHFYSFQFSDFTGNSATKADVPFVMPFLETASHCLGKLSSNSKFSCRSLPCVGFAGVQHRALHSSISTELEDAECISKATKYSVNSLSACLNEGFHGSYPIWVNAASPAQTALASLRTSSCSSPPRAVQTNPGSSLSFLLRFTSSQPLSLLHLYVPVASCSERQDTPLQCWFLCTQIRGMPKRFWQPSGGCWFPSPKVRGSLLSNGTRY